KWLLIDHKSCCASGHYKREEIAAFYIPQGINSKTVSCPYVGTKHILWHLLLGTAFLSGTQWALVATGFVEGSMSLWAWVMRPCF
ncbi:mCG145241, partial [Mus musculus]